MEKKRQEIPKQKKNNTVLVAIPTLGMISAAASKSCYTHGFPIFCSPAHHEIYDKPVDIARNEFAKIAMEANLQFILFRDDDVIAPQEAPNKLLNRLSLRCQTRGEDPEAADAIVGGVVYSKIQPPTPMIYKNHVVGGFQDWHVNDLVECDIIGMGCTLIPTGMFHRVKPWVTTRRCVNYDCPDNYMTTYIVADSKTPATNPLYKEMPEDGNCPFCKHPLLDDFFKTIKGVGDWGEPAGCTEDGA